DHRPAAGDDARGHRPAWRLWRVPDGRGAELRRARRLQLLPAVGRHPRPDPGAHRVPLWRETGRPRGDAAPRPGPAGVAVRADAGAIAGATVATAHRRPAGTP